MQNSPEGVRLAVQQRADFVELDVVRLDSGGYVCAHGLSSRWPLADCLAQVGGDMEVMLHLKGRYEAPDLIRLAGEIEQQVPLNRVVFAAHGSAVLHRLREVLPDVRLARFGLLPALASLWRQQPWEYCLINSLVLQRWLVSALQKRGYYVVASCVWEWRSRRSIEKLGVDGAFVNLHRNAEDQPI